MSNNWFIGSVEYFILHKSGTHFVVDEYNEVYHQGRYNDCLAWLESAYIGYIENIY